MITSIHNISEGIIRRKSLKWKVGFPDNQTIDCQSVFNGISELMEQKHRKLSADKNKINNIMQCVLNIYAVKNRLEEQPWFIPGNLKPEENRCFLQDLDFYMMISGILLKVNNLFKGFVSKCKSLSIVQMLPVINSHPKRVRQAVGQLPDSAWMQTVMYHQEENAYIKVLQQGESVLGELEVSGPLSLLLSKVYQVFNLPPENQQDEEVLTAVLAEINQQVSSISQKKNEIEIETWSVLRQILIASMQMDMSNKISLEYQDVLEKLIEEGVVNAGKEVLFIKKKIRMANCLSKKGAVLNPDFIIELKGIKDYLIKVEKEDWGHSIYGKYIEWTHSPKDFVKKVQGMISKGYISVKGNSDTLPIVQILSRFVKVRKQNDSGNMKLNSLLTYFNKESSGDL